MRRNNILNNINSYKNENQFQKKKTTFDDNDIYNLTPNSKFFFQKRKKNLNETISKTNESINNFNKNIKSETPEIIIIDIPYDHQNSYNSNKPKSDLSSNNSLRRFLSSSYQSPISYEAPGVGICEPLLSQLQSNQEIPFYNFKQQCYGKNEIYNSNNLNNQQYPKVMSMRRNNMQYYPQQQYFNNWPQQPQPQQPIPQRPTDNQISNNVQVNGIKSDFDMFNVGKFLQFSPLNMFSQQNENMGLLSVIPFLNSASKNINNDNSNNIPNRRNNHVVQWGIGNINISPGGGRRLNPVYQNNGKEMPMLNDFLTDMKNKLYKTV